MVSRDILYHLTFAVKSDGVISPETILLCFLSFIEMVIPIANSALNFGTNRL